MTPLFTSAQLAERVAAARSETEAKQALMVILQRRGKLVCSTIRCTGTALPALLYIADLYGKNTNGEVTRYHSASGDTHLKALSKLVVATEHWGDQ